MLRERQVAEGSVRIPDDSAFVIRARSGVRKSEVEKFILAEDKKGIVSFNAKSSFPGMERSKRSSEVNCCPSPSRTIGSQARRTIHQKV